MCVVVVYSIDEGRQRAVAVNVTAVNVTAVNACMARCVRAGAATPPHDNGRELDAVRPRVDAFPPWVDAVPAEVA